MGHKKSRSKAEKLHLERPLKNSFISSRIKSRRASRLGKNTRIAPAHLSSGKSFFSKLGDCFKRNVGSSDQTATDEERKERFHKIFYSALETHR